MALTMGVNNYQRSIVCILAILCLLNLKDTILKSFYLPSFSINKIKGNNFHYKTSAPLILNGVHDRLISGLEINNSAINCIQLVDCYNITIQNCRLTGSKGNGIDIYRCKNITIRNCYMENIVTGIYALDSQGVKVLNNQVKNVLGPFPRGQMVQFNNVSGKNNLVSYNRCENILGVSNPEDVINMYKTNGTPDSPVKITGNWIRGGGPSKTGGGIMLGDSGGSYLVAENNILVNPGQYGIAISSGTNIKILNNKIFSKKQHFTNVGLYVWNQYPSACALNTVSGNAVNWTNAEGEKNNSRNNENCETVFGWSDNTFDANIDSTILPSTILTK